MNISLYNLALIINKLLAAANVSFTKVIINASLNITKCFNINEWNDSNFIIVYIYFKRKFINAFIYIRK